MKKLRQSAIILPLLLSGYCFTSNLSAQMITGVWKGKINRQKVEVKLIQDGDSLKGTSYYYESANNYRRYSIKGYFDQNTNSAVWWDDQLLEEKSGRFTISEPGKIPMLSRADFNSDNCLAGSCLTNSSTCSNSMSNFISICQIYKIVAHFFCFDYKTEAFLCVKEKRKSTHL